MTLREEFEKETGYEALIKCNGQYKYNSHYVEWLEKKINHKSLPQKTKDSMAMLKNMVYDHTSESTKMAFEHIELELQYIADRQEVMERMVRFEYIKKSLDMLLQCTETLYDRVDVSVGYLNKVIEHLEKAME